MPAEIPARSTNCETVAIRLSKILVVTGTPGSGKTTVSRLMAKSLNGIHMDCGRLALREGLIHRYDPATGSYVVDSQGLSRRLHKILKYMQKDVILEGHVIPSIPGFAPSRVFVLRCHPNLLITRLKRRGYSRRKIAENIAAEILDSCLEEAVELFGIKKIVELDASNKRPAQVASLAFRTLLEEVKGTRNHIDWIGRLERKGRLYEILNYVEAETGRDSLVRM
jgi:adenylate kinase